MCQDRIRKLTNALSLSRRPARAAIGAGLMLAVLAAARADDSAKLKINRSVTVDGTGDALVKLEGMHATRLAQLEAHAGAAV